MMFSSNLCCMLNEDHAVRIRSYKLTFRVYLRAESDVGKGGSIPDPDLTTRRNNPLSFLFRTRGHLPSYGADQSKTRPDDCVEKCTNGCMLSGGQRMEIRTSDKKFIFLFAAAILVAV